MTLEEALTLLRDKRPDASAQGEAQARLDGLAKPLHSLGLLEDMVVKIAGITGSAELDLSKKCVVVFCADNGVVAEGVTQTGSEITALVAENLSKGITTVNRMAACAGAKVLPVDIGVAREVKGPLCRKIAFGTKNLAVEPAMTRQQTTAALEVGIQLAGELKQEGFSILATGEMGIGNTTTSSAVLAALLQIPARQVTGRGAGLSTQGLERKIQVIEQALALHRPDPGDPLDVLSKVGGLDIAGMAGLFLGGGVYGIPVVIDGLISGVAALIAQRLAPGIEAYMLPSHQSAEPAGELVLSALGLTAPLRCGMCLGEGTGAVALFPLLDMVEAVYRETSTFAEISMEPSRTLV